MQKGIFIGKCNKYEWSEHISLQCLPITATIRPLLRKGNAKFCENLASILELSSQAIMVVCSGPKKSNNLLKLPTHVEANYSNTRYIYSL